MKTTSILLLLLMIMLPVSLFADASYNVQVLPEGAFALNDLGQVALRSLQGRDDGGVPYYSIQLWQSGSITTLGAALFAEGCGLNNLGQVAGNYVSGSSYVGRIWSATGITDISSDGHATVSSINDVGCAAGTYGSDSTSCGYIWDGKTITELTAPGAVGGIGYSINNSDQVLGLAVYQVASEGCSYLKDRPVIWHSGTVSFLDEEGFDALPYKINNAGQVLGYYSTPDTWVLWSNGTTTTPVSGLGYGLNDMGQVVGSYLSQESRNSSAFLWQNGSMTGPQFSSPDWFIILSYERDGHQ